MRIRLIEKDRGKFLSVNIAFLAGAVVGDYIYFSDWLSNGLYCLNIMTGECEPLTVFLDERNTPWLHNYAFLFNGMVWFIPNEAEKIAYYDIKENELNYISLPDKGKRIVNSNGKKPFRFFACREGHGPICWLAPIGYNLLLRLDMGNKCIEEITGMPGELEWKDGVINFYGGCMSGGHLVMCPYDAKFGISIDVYDCSISKRGINWTFRRYRYIIPWKGKQIYVPFRMDSPLLVYDCEERIGRIIPISDPPQATSVYLAYGIIKDEIMLFPFIGEKAIHINMEDGHAYTFPLPVLDRHTGAGFYFQRCISYGKGLLVSSDRKPLILKVDPEKEYSILEIKLNGEQYNRILVELFNKHCEKPCFQNLFYFEDTVKIATFCRLLKSKGRNYCLGTDIGNSIYGTARRI